MGDPKVLDKVQVKSHLQVAGKFLSSLISRVCKLSPIQCLISVFLKKQ